MHTILSGPVNSGKSTRLWQDVKKWIGEGKKVSGWVCIRGEGAGIRGQAEGYDIVFITMSKIHEPQPFIRTTPFENSFAWRRFYFDQTVFDKAATIDFGRPDIFVIDEVGPLELEEKKGFWAGLPKIYKDCANTITVVRLALIDEFKGAFKEFNFIEDQLSSSSSSSSSS